MKRLKLLMVVSLVISAGAGMAPAQKKDKTLKQTLEELLPGMGAEKISARQGPQQQWQRICFQAGAPGNAGARAEVCKLMAEKLGPQTPTAARIWLLKQLQFIGRGECVDAVAKVLDDSDPHVRDAARRCLANNPDPKATAPLVARLQSTGDNAFKVGLLNALGYRGDAAAAAAAAKELAGADQAVACAAARALGKIATPRAAEALAAARAGAKGELRFRISDASMLCARSLLAAGKADEAMAIYKELSKPGERRRIRLAALGGMLKAAGDQAGQMTLKFLAADDADARAMAAAGIRDLPPGAIDALAAGISKLPATGQALLLGALAAKGDKAAMPVAVAAAKSDAEPLKVAGLRALATLGDASAVGVLIEAMFAGGEAGRAGREGLMGVYGKGVNESIVAAMQAQKDVRRRADLIGVLDAREARSAAGALLKEAVGDDANVRRRAMSALRRLAEPKHVPGMVAGLLKAEKGRERDDAERAILAVCQQIAEKDKRADPVFAAAAGAAEADKTAILPLLGRLGGAKAMQMIQDALKSSSAEYREAGVRALCNWPDAAALDPLLALLGTSKQPRHRASALEGIVRVITAPSDRPRADQAAAAGKALAAARAALTDPDAEVREAAVRALADWPSPEAAPDLLKLAGSAAKANLRILALRGYVRLAEVVARRSAPEALKMYQQALAQATRPDEKKQVLSGVGRIRSLEALQLVVPCLADEAIRDEAAAAAVSIAERIRSAHPREVRAALEKVLAAAKNRRTRQRAQEILKGTPSKGRR